MKTTKRKTAVTKKAAVKKTGTVRKVMAPALKAGDLFKLSEREIVTLKPIQDMVSASEVGIKTLAVSLNMEREMLWKCVRSMRPELAGWEMTLTSDNELRLVFPKFKK